VQASHVSEETSRKIEEEVRKLIQAGMDDARRIMTDSRDEWSAIANGLLEYETLTGEEINDLLNGKPPTRPDLDAEDSGPGSAVPVIGKRRKPKDDPGSATGDPEPNPA
jgi:cell division protease FtsH